MNLTSKELEQRNRLKTVLEVKNIDRQQFADAIGRKIGYVNQMLSGNRRISETTVSRLSKRYKDVNPDWIMNGVGEMLLPNREQEMLSEEAIKAQEYRAGLIQDLSVALRYAEMRIKDIERDIERLLQEKAEQERHKRKVEGLIEELRQEE